MVNGQTADIGYLHGAEFRRCLLELDVVGIRRLWKHVASHLPQPSSDDEALVMLHMARTAAQSVPERLRAYSKAWLAERERAKVANAVGISIRSPEHRRSQAEDAKAAMADVVLSAHQAGIDLDVDAAEVSRRMTNVRRKIIGR